MAGGAIAALRRPASCSRRARCGTRASPALLRWPRGLRSLAFPVPAPVGPVHAPLPDAALPAGRRARGLGSRPRAPRRAAPGSWSWRCAGCTCAGGTRLLARLAQRGPARGPVPAAGPRTRARGARGATASAARTRRTAPPTGSRTRAASAIVVSQPWNERFLHHPLPYLDEVRFATRTAWVLTPAYRRDLPAPAALRGRAARRPAGSGAAPTPGARSSTTRSCRLPVRGGAARRARARSATATPGTTIPPDAAQPAVLRLPAPAALDARDARGGIRRAAAAAQHGRRGQRGRRDVRGGRAAAGAASGTTCAG